MEHPGLVRIRNLLSFEINPCWRLHVFSACHISGTEISSHKYNTRNSGKKALLVIIYNCIWFLSLYSVKLKKLYVDLGSNRIDPNIISEFLNRQREPNLEVNANPISNQINRRDSDTFSQDSRQFDINSNSFIDQLRFRLIMDERRRLCTTNPQQNVWKKYCYAFCKSKFF